MTTIQDICDFLESFAPTDLAENWDNVGLIVGDPGLPVTKIMTCLTVTPPSADEAIARGADLIVSHHPLPFRPLNRLTTIETPSQLLWKLIRAGVSIYSPHTGFDSATSGINQLLGERLGLSGLRPLVPSTGDSPVEAEAEVLIGAGRHGRLAAPVTISAFAESIKRSFGLDAVKVVAGGDGLATPVQHVAVACGSGGSFLNKAIENGCDTFVTGETTFHTCLEAQARNVSLVLTGHYASERFAVEVLADTLAAEFSGLEIWASEKESDPVNVI